LQQTTCWQYQFCDGLCQLIHSLHSNSIEYTLIREDLPINMILRELFMQGQHCRWLAFIVVKTDCYGMADGKRILSKSQSSSGRTKLLTPRLTQEIRNDQPLTREVCSRK